MVEMLGGIETVRVLNTVQEEVDKIGKVAEDLRQKEIRHHIYMALYDAGKYLNEGFFYILVISLSILLSAYGTISRGDILVYSILFLSITGPLREIHRILDQAHESSIQVNDLYNLLEQKNDSSFFSESSVIINKQRKDNPVLSINKLSFSYPGKEKYILDNIDLEINPGEKIGIAGASGCGKTTLVKIILKLVHGYSGSIYLFGKNLKELTREEIAEKIAYVPQKPYIFSGTIEENIVYGSNRSVQEKEVIKAIKLAGLYEEIMDVLGGLDGNVTENGNNLSGGQRQRLAIARLVLKSPEILIFDEATSALDNRNEALIQKNIEDYFKNKIMITVAHRLTTLINTDRIYVFDKGMIMQAGKFDCLAEQKGLFQNFLKQKTDVITT
ncbi:MAG: hypothetical protein UT63_C0072G0015 [Candidatus Gottesmanbacteria bacterium GW2011_GWC2_39_8]|uniref:Uncharacterized protein n=1 Tax=Candidatus Gottesmanbacteria bacterium GW2011_GWC2_39_8 TaxID=1618450 RepID=A0A0G0PT92_9BACT|nr:MAG: hypothetical protein UT63_C0072G0015 [Candidatus Gottesmanbacteria bacterium GW2011_GWC2_39_8]